MSTDGTCGSNTGAVFARSAVDDGIDGDLDRVLVGCDMNLEVEYPISKTFFALSFRGHSSIAAPISI